MRICFVLPAVNLAGGSRVIALHAQHLQNRGHQVTVVATPREVPSWPDRVKSWLRGEGWPDTNPIGPSHFDHLGTKIDLRRIESIRPIVDQDVPDADVVI